MITIDSIQHPTQLFSFVKFCYSKRFNYSLNFFEYKRSHTPVFFDDALQRVINGCFCHQYFDE